MFSKKFLENATHYGSGIFLLLVVAYLYDRYKQKENELEYYENQAIVQKYLLNKDFNGDKPFLWIPLIHELNSRQWITNNSRTSFNLNQPYLESTVQSIIKYCSKDFNICILDDDSYGKLLPNWSIVLTEVPEPIRNKMRKLVWLKILEEYGGLFVPPSFLCIETLKPIYDQCSPLVSVEEINRGSSSEYTVFTPSFSFMGSKPNCKIVKDSIQRFEHLVSQEYTSESEFWNQWTRWCEEMKFKGYMTVIDGEYIGIKKDNREITVEEMLSERNGYELFKQTKYGILIPQNQILKRTAYEWFSRMSIDQITKSHLALAKYFSFCKCNL